MGNKNSIYTRERPGVVAFVNIFMKVSAAVGHYVIVPPQSFHILVESHSIFD
jgi:hypothetical protein